MLCGFAAVSGRAAAAALWILGALLAGYAAMGRGFAYLGLPPFYVGEIALAGCALILAMAMVMGYLSAPRLPIALLLFLGWCAVRTAADVPQYGVFALRDAAIWGYGAFAVIVATVVRRAPYRAAILTWYRRLSVLLLGWYSWLALAKLISAEPIFPNSPSGVPVVVVKPGDIAVHLAGIGSFLALGFHAGSGTHRVGRSGLRAGILWILWAFCFLYYGSHNRGGLVALLVAMAALGALAFRRSVVPAAAIGLALILVAAVRPWERDWISGRQASPRQILQNLKSLTGSEDAFLEGTRQWRLRWWRTVIDYTFYGPYRWTGKGFGPNLANEDGFQVRPDGALRSPHNGHITILARTGVPGLALWLGLNAWFALRVLRRLRSWKRAGRPQWAQLAWVFCYWAAAFVNATFDVYLESPQGGIWFWSLLGLGIALAYDSAGDRSTDPSDGKPRFRAVAGRGSWSVQTP
ncbi:MAG: O-antigen ligase family protein [Bryobacteraceae bacterium]|nr:O-antigen ligase family protein [Bryobacteraceae bacterium]